MLAGCDGCKKHYQVARRGLGNIFVFKTGLEAIVEITSHFAAAREEQEKQVGWKQKRVVVAGGRDSRDSSAADKLLAVIKTDA